MGLQIIRSSGETVRFRNMPEVMPLEEDGNVADEHGELHFADGIRDA